MTGRQSGNCREGRAVRGRGRGDRGRGRGDRGRGRGDRGRGDRGRGRGDRGTFGMTTRTAAPSNDRETRSDNIGNTDNNGGQGPTPKLFIFSEEEVLRYGLEFVGFDELRRKKVEEEKNVERFRSFFGVGHKAVTALIKDFPNKDKVFNLQHLFLALNFAKTYDTHVVLSGWWKLSETTIDTWVWYYLKKIQELKEKKIYLGDFKIDSIFGLTVDGAHFRTREQRKNPSAKVYSHKFNGPGVAYEIAVAIYEDRVVWINGPFDPSTHDLTIFRSEDGLEANMPDRMRGIGDSAYKAGDAMTVHREGHSKEMTNFINRVRARHENFNARMKNFNILSECFRSNRDKHETAFEAICILCQYDMENGHPLMEA